MIRVLAVLLLLASPALAQQPTPCQVAIQVVTVINSWAQALEGLQAENARLKAKIEELEKAASKPAAPAQPGQ